MTRTSFSERIRALIVDDSSSNGGPLSRMLERDGDIFVVGQSPTGVAAIGLVAQESPDVVVLDLRTGDGSGLHFIEQVMAQTPTPILVLSSKIEDRRSQSAVEALVAGALDALPAPDRWTADLETQLRYSVRQISKVHVIRHPRGGVAKNSGPSSLARSGRQPVVALAASTGGPKALATVLSKLGGLRAPVLVVQHLHPDFTSGLFDWMARTSALPVEIAQHDQVAEPGRVYLAPGGFHLRLAANLRLELGDRPVMIHRPSANELFHSVAEQAGSAGVGVLMTGMGDDGAQGLLEIQLKRGQTFGQDEASCAVFGMPRAAQRLGAVTCLLPPDQLATAILRAVSALQI
jgi:two-component system chemotaxis response regulator CheB